MNSKLKACIDEGFEPDGNYVWAYNRRFPIADPLSIHLNVYRTDESHDTRYNAMYNAFRILWPAKVPTYNYWMERIFREHCDNDTEIFTVSSGGGCGKSYTAAYLASIFFLANPLKRTVIVTSTTVESLKSRIYGYIQAALTDIKHIHIPLLFKTSPPPSIAYPNSEGKADGRHGIFGIAAKQGSDDKAIQDIIGRHPDDGILVILDEAPDMPVGITTSLPNLKKGLRGKFQAIALGNARDVNDLHGALSTPEVGWDNLDPHKTFRWRTTQPHGICLYLNPYDSPAIHETDPKKKKLLSEFLITEDKLIEAERAEGKDSDAFWRFTMGFWRSRLVSKTLVTEAFLKDYDPQRRAEFSGKYPLVMCAGLDPAFSTGGDKCMLRLAVLGHTTSGLVALDFRDTSLMFPIPILANAGKSAELQIADRVLEVLRAYGIPIHHLCVDASGQGRGLADVILLRSGSPQPPIKIYSARHGAKHKDVFDIRVMNSYELWFAGRDFISNRQIFGLDALTYNQLHTRQVIEKNGKRFLESKSEYKKRMTLISDLLGRSPDEADAAMLCIQSAIINHGFHVGQRRSMEGQSEIAQAIHNYQQQMKAAVQVELPKVAYSGKLHTLMGKRYI